MDSLSVLAIAFGLAMDAFSVAVAVGVTLGAVTPRHTFRLAFHFGLFQFLMPAIGWLAGLTLQRYISALDHWVAFALLTYVGGHMIWSAVRGEEEEIRRGDPTRGLSLVILSIATSIDALAVGFSLALIRVEVWGPGVVIGLVAAMMTASGLHLGQRLGRVLQKRAEVVGGLVLIAIGLRILLTHLPI